MLKFIKWTFGIIFIGIVGLIVLGTIVQSNQTPEEKAAAEAKRKSEMQADIQKKQEQAVSEMAEMQAELQQKQEQAVSEMAAIPAYTAADMVKAYNDNSVAADQLFKDKKYKVTGVITDINTDFLGRPLLMLNGGVNPFMQPQFIFDKEAGADLAKLRKGMKVTLICVGKGDVAKTPMSDECLLM